MLSRRLPPSEPLTSDGMLADTLAQLEREWQPEAEPSAPVEATASGEMRRRYRDDPCAWVHDCLWWLDGQQPTPYQDEVLAELPRRKRVAVRGPHGLGKTATQAWIVLWFATTREPEDWKLPTTASAWRQLTKYLWPEIHKWARRLRWDVLGREPFNARTELQSLSLKLGGGEAFAVASDTPELIEGAHADALLYLFDESKTIPRETFDAAEGALSGGHEAYAVAMSTPGEPHGRFYDIHRRAPGFEDWWVRHVTMDEAIAAGRMGRDWAEQRALQWGVQSAVYQNRVLGEFAASDEDGIIPLAWIELANERWREWQEAGGVWSELTSVGVDVARSGKDVTVKALRSGLMIVEIRRAPKQDTMATTGQVKGILDAYGGYAAVDVIGLGAGVVDRLRELRQSVLAFNAAAKSEAKDRSGELGFVNQRSEAWWRMRELLDPDNGEPVALPPDDLLTGDLTAPHWRVVSGGRIQVESKETIEARIGRSTDTGDSVVQAFTPLEEPPVVQTSVLRMGRGRVRPRDF